MPMTEAQVVRKMNQRKSARKAEDSIRRQAGELSALLECSSQPVLVAEQLNVLSQGALCIRLAHGSMRIPAQLSA